MIAALCRLIAIAGRRLGGWLRLQSVRLRYGWGHFPATLSIGSGVRLAMTDGGSFAFGRNVTIDARATLLATRGKIRIGDDGYVGIGTVIVSRHAIEIGEGALIAEYVTIRDQDHAVGDRESGPPTVVSSRRESGAMTAPIIIGRNVWLGAKVTVTRGVTIGDNAVVGANAVVTKDIPANALAAGVPARVIRLLDGPA